MPHSDNNLRVEDFPIGSLVKIVRPNNIHLSSFPKLTILSPKVASKTTASIVATVTRANIVLININPEVIALAAGSMNTGISGSQGPSTNMVNKIQLVIFFSLVYLRFLAWQRSGCWRRRFERDHHARAFVCSGASF